MQKAPDLALYDQSFFKGLEENAYKAAKVLLPRLYALYPFNSFVDFGCGAGAWLLAADETIQSPEKMLTGIDGIYAKDIVICKSANYMFQNLEQRIEVGKHDLAISLEVAEHLTPKRAATFIEDICKASDVVFFSAAVEGQGGINHVNEQPQSYWRTIFGKHGYHPFDFHRSRYWDNPVFESCPYYISSSFLYIKEGTPLYAKLLEYKLPEDALIDIVHPALLRWKSNQPYPFRWHLLQLLPSLVRAIRRRLSMQSPSVTHSSKGSNKPDDIHAR